MLCCVPEVYVEINGGVILQNKGDHSLIFIGKCFFLFFFFYFISTSFSTLCIVKWKQAVAEIRRVTFPDQALSDLLFINWMSTMVVVVVGH